MSEFPEKGEIPGGRCNVTACQKPGAWYFNKSTRAYYCQDCAKEINWPGGRADTMALYGTPLLCEMDDSVLSELTAAKSEIERLRRWVAAVTSLAEALADGITKDLQADNAWEQREADGKIAKAHEDYLVFRENNPDTESQAWLLRKQAEAINQSINNYFNIDNGPHGLKDHLEWQAQRIRQQAEAAEKGGDDE